MHGSNGIGHSLHFKEGCLLPGMPQQFHSRITHQIQITEVPPIILKYHTGGMFSLRNFKYLYPTLPHIKNSKNPPKTNK